MCPVKKVFVFICVRNYETFLLKENRYGMQRVVCVVYVCVCVRRKIWLQPARPILTHAWRITYFLMQTLLYEILGNKSVKFRNNKGSEEDDSVN